MEHTAIISLGSNVKEKATILSNAIKLLDVNILSMTQPYIDPDDNNETAPYLNVVALIETAHSYESTRLRFKDIETQLGRDRSKEAVAIDIDIVVWNNEIVRTHDYNRPYFKRGLTNLPPIALP